MGRAHALQMAKEHTISAGVFGGGNRMLLLYWITPATIVLFWGRYLTLEDLRGSTVEALFAAGSVFAAMNFPRMASKVFGAELQPLSQGRNNFPWAMARIQTAVPAAVGSLLFLLSVGII